MEKTFLARENFYERTEVKNRNHLSVICLAYFRNCADTFYPSESLVERILVRTEDVHNTLMSLSILSDGNGSTCLFLDLLDSLTAFTDNCTDEVRLDLKLLESRNERLVVLTRLADAFHHLAHDVESALTSLLQCFCKHIIRKTVHLDVHLSCSNTVLGTCNLEVHISEVILVSENIGKDCISLIRSVLVGDKTHRNTCNRFLDLHAGIHKCEATSTYRSH